MVMSEDEKLQRRAARKAKAVNDKIKADVGPLFVEQIPKEEFTTPTDEYWKYRQSWAISPRGEDAAYLAGIDWKVDLMLLRNLARKVMTPDDFAIASGKQDRFGDVQDFWKNILLGRRRIVIAFDRTSYGFRPCYAERDNPDSRILCYIEQVELKERLVWPPEGYTPPMTPAQLEQWFKDLIPEPHDLPGQVDPLGLAEI